MAATLLESPPDDGHLWIPPGALGPGIKMRYTLGRNDGRYLNRSVRRIITMEISHTMGGSSTESMQAFANSEMGSNATLAEVATFVDGSFLQSLPLDVIGAGSVKGGACGITHESAELAGDPNAQPWTPMHLATKVALTAWLIRNPLLAAGDRKWSKLQIRHQIVTNPYGPSPDVGGLGDHTMWDTCGTAMGGANPWTLYCKSCPGWVRRGTTRKVQFPTSQVTDIPLTEGNFRDYYERVGRALKPVQPPTTTAKGDLVLTIFTVAGANAVFMGFTWQGIGQQVEWLPNQGMVDLYRNFSPKEMTIQPEDCKNLWLIGPVPFGDTRHSWTEASFRGVLAAT